jgi:CRISPR-associated protein Cas2
MLTWVIYDISNDRNRARFSNACKNCGLHRVQRSCFVGSIPRNRMDELATQAETMIDDDDVVFIFPQTRNNFERMRMIGMTLSKKQIADELATEFF